MPGSQAVHTYILQSAQEIKSSAKHLLDCNEVSTHSRPDGNSSVEVFLEKYTAFSTQNVFAYNSP